MIVVVGVPSWRPAEPAGPAGRAGLAAIAAAARGARVEVVGRIGDDPAGDALVLAFARAGVGHAALLRDPARPTPVEAPVADLPAGDEEAAAFGDGREPDEAGTAAAPMSAAAPTLEAADVALGLRYLTEFRVLVLSDDAPDPVLPVAVEAAGFASAHLVALVPAGRRVPEGLPEDATVLAAPEGEDEGPFAQLVGAYAAALDAGALPEEAFAAATAGVGWEALAGG